MNLLHWRLFSSSNIYILSRTSLAKQERSLKTSCCMGTSNQTADGIQTKGIKRRGKRKRA